MPNIQSAFKRVRTSAKANANNRTVRSEIHTLRRRLFESFEKGEKEEARKLYRAYCSVLDKAAKKGVIKKNTADRRKGRCAAQLAKLA